MGPSSPRYRVGDTVLDDVDGRLAQQLLAAAHARHDRPLCLCHTPYPGPSSTTTQTTGETTATGSTQGVEMYVARTPRGRLILKRLPGSGPEHHPDCDSYEPPGDLSGRGTIELTDDPNGLTRLRLAIPLSRHSDTTAEHPEPSTPNRPETTTASRRTTSPGRASLAAVLDYLWEEAGLHRWSPRMAGKRNWAVIRHHLTRAADATLVDDGQLLSDLLWIPEPYNPGRREAIETRRRQWWSRLEPTGPERPFAIAVVEWAGIKPARYGLAITARQVGWPPFMIDTVAYQALRDRFDQIDLHRQHPDGHLVMATTFSLSRGGYPIVEDAAFLALDHQWLPYTTSRAHALLADAVAAGRRFTTPLRYDSPANRTLPAIVLTDTPVPVAAYADTTPDQITDPADPGAAETWAWSPGATLPPPFPHPRQA